MSNVNDCFSHELGGDTLTEYYFNKVKQKTGGGFGSATGFRSSYRKFGGSKL